MPKTKSPKCPCPKCGTALTLDELKRAIPDCMLKSLWASYGSRARTGRVIAPELQAKMQAARAAAKERRAE